MKKQIFILIIVSAFIILSATDYAESFLSNFPSSVGEGARGNLYTYSNSMNPMFFYNPANSSTQETDRTFVGYEHKFLYSNSSQFNSASVILPSIRKVRLGLGYINQIISGIPIYPEYSDSVSFDPEGYFSDNANCILLNVSYIYSDQPLSRYSVSCGANIKSVIHTIYENFGFGAGLDMGLNASYYLGAKSSASPSKVSLGVSLKDVGGTKIKWDTALKTSETREMQYALAGSYDLELKSIKSQIFVECNYSNREDGTVGLSLMYEYNEMMGVFTGMNEFLNAEDENLKRDMGGRVFVDIIGFGIYYGISKLDIGFNHSVGLRYRV